MKEELCKHPFRLNKKTDYCSQEAQAHAFVFNSLLLYDCNSNVECNTLRLLVNRCPARKVGIELNQLVAWRA